MSPRPRRPAVQSQSFHRRRPQRSPYGSPSSYRMVARKPARLRGWLIAILVGLGFALGSGLAWVGTTWNPFSPSPSVTQQGTSEEVAVLDLEAEPAADSPTDLVPVANPQRPYEIHPWARQSYVPVIMYHDVVESTKQIWFDHTVAELRRDFEAIQAAGATPISINDLYDHLRNGTDLPEKPIVLTFDDAYLGLYENAFPLLKEFNFPATYYVQTGFVGVPTSKDHFTWEQMQEMDASGLIEIAAHTINHPEDLRTLDDEALRREIFEPKRLLEERLGHEIRHFSYPAGNRDERVMKMVEGSRICDGHHYGKWLRRAVQ